jgi:hypothetical protein
MNELFKRHGYLEGDPGDYRLTEKGQQYAKIQYHSRGTGGSAQYNRGWDTVAWNDETAGALQADMKANPGGGVAEDALVEGGDDDGSIECEPSLNYSASDDEGSEFGWKGPAIVGAIVGVILIAPHAKHFYDDRAKPAAKKLRDKLMTRKLVEAEALEATVSRGAQCMSSSENPVPSILESTPCELPPNSGHGNGLCL